MHRWYGRRGSKGSRLCPGRGGEGEVSCSGHHPSASRVLHPCLTQVCGDSFGDLEATVACRDLGLPTPGRVLGAQFGPGAATSPIWLESVSCSGNEKRIQDCKHSERGA